MAYKDPDYMKKWREKNKVKIREYARKYCSDNRKKVSEMARKWNENNRDKYNKYRRNLTRRKFEKSENFRNKRAAQRKRWIERFKLTHGIAYSTFMTKKVRDTQKGKARVILSNAIAHKKIERPDSCSKCLKKCIPQGHHFDYSKPLEVIWICHKCHRKEHRID